jgi:hypothetical protein
MSTVIFPDIDVDHFFNWTPGELIFADAFAPEPPTANLAVRIHRPEN